MSQSSSTLLLFGATGDLARRMLLPSLYALHEDALIAEDLRIVGTARSEMSDAEFREITRWVRANTLERFGPVRSVPPVQVFEIAFEGIQASTRHKSGIALRFPRMARWRTDKPVSEINTLADLKALLALLGG